MNEGSFTVLGRQKYKECENKGLFSLIVTIVLNLYNLLFVVRQDNCIFALIHQPISILF